MTHTKFLRLALIFTLPILLLDAATGLSQEKATNGILKIHVSPKQAYVFVDDQAIRDGSQAIALDAGKHVVEVRNYGYFPEKQDVQITSGKKTELTVALHPSGDKVSGPFGDIELKGHPRAAVLLNGATPAYFAGHVDEFDNNWIWHQWLLVKPGSYQVTVTQRGQTFWSGAVNVEAGKRVVVYLNHNGEMKTRDFKPGLKLGPQQRFEAGIASARVPIAPVAAQLSASQTDIACGQSATLNWSAADAADTSISYLGNVDPSGNRTVAPAQTTTYQLVAKGPGGQVTQAATIDVDAQPTATLSLSQPQVLYHKIGDKVVEQTSASLNWSTGNASAVSIEQFGNVPLTGTENIEATPEQTGDGAINRDVVYTLTAVNACGGKTTQTATLHFTGSIDSAPAMTLASVFYPTNYPGQRAVNVGLVSSQKEILTKAAASFKNNEQYDPQNKLVVVGFADVRGPGKHNLALSERRAELVKDYLVSQGVAPEKVETRAEGNGDQLDEQHVDELVSQDAQPVPAFMTARKKATWLAYNRRVDIILQPSGQESVKAYPADAADARLLWQRQTPSLKIVETATGPQTDLQDSAVASKSRPQQ